MKLQMLPSSIDESGLASSRQHLLSIIVDDKVAVDAGCLAFSCTDLHREQVRDIVLTHTHLDHIAGLPMYIDDLFSKLTEPIIIHATREMIDILETHVFNWAIYPRFSELSNEFCRVVEYREFDRGSVFDVKHLTFQCVGVNHKVSANGYVVSNDSSAVAITGDTAETDEFWQVCNVAPNLKAVLVECAFPDELSDLATISDHLSPERLKIELQKFSRSDIPIYLINIKPMYRDRVIAQIEKANIPNVSILELGRVYEF